MHEVVLLVGFLTKNRAQSLDVGRFQGMQPREIFLLFNDRVEVAAIGNIKADLADTVDFPAEIGWMQERWNVDQLNRVDMLSSHLVPCHDQACWRVQPHDAWLTRTHKTVFDRGGDGADGSVTTHRQTTAHLDKENRDIAVGTSRGIQDRAGHDFVSAGLEHQGRADPVELLLEVSAALDHVCTLEYWGATSHHAHRVAAGVAVDTEEGAFHLSCSGSPIKFPRQSRDA